MEHAETAIRVTPAIRALLRQASERGDARFVVTSADGEAHEAARQLVAHGYARLLVVVQTDTETRRLYVLTAGGFEMRSAVEG